MDGATREFRHTHPHVPAMPAATIDLFLLSKAERLVSASAAVAAAVGVVSMVAAVEPRNLFFFSFFFLFFFFLFSFFFFFTCLAHSEAYVVYLR